MAKMRVKTRSPKPKPKTSGGGPKGGGGPVERVKRTFSDVLGEGGSGLMKLTSLAAGGYAVTGALDLAADPIMEAIFGHEGQKLELARQELENKRKATEEMLGFYAREEATARGERKASRAQELIAGRLGAEEEGMEARSPDILGEVMGHRATATADAQSARDLLLPVILQLSQAEQSQQPISPLLAAGLAV